MAEMMDLIENIAKFTEGGAISIGGGEISTGGGEISTSGGEISTSGGEISTGGGEISIAGGEISIGGGEISTGGEAISIGGGMIYNRVSTNLKGRAYSRTFQENYPTFYRPETGGEGIHEYDDREHRDAMRYSILPRAIAFNSIAK